MDNQHFNQNKPSNILPFNKSRQRISARKRSHSPTRNNQIFKTLNGFLNLPLQLVRATTALLFFVTSSLFQILLRIAYGGILTIGLGLLASAGTLALFAGGKTPAHFWPSVWHGESVLLLLTLGGFLLDGALVALQITIGAIRTSKPQRA